MANDMSSIVNTNDIEHLLKLDEFFGVIDRLYGSPPDWQRPEGFVSLVHIILEQQVSLQSAKAHFDRLDAYLTAFTPTEILKLTDTEMHQCQVSRQKAKYLRALASAIVEGSINLEELRHLPKAEVRRQLKSVKGIGNWTADIYLMFCLQAKDIFPVGDIAIINTLKELTGARTAEEIDDRASRWRPYRSLASYFLWHYYLRKRGR